MTEPHKRNAARRVFTRLAALFRLLLMAAITFVLLWLPLAAVLGHAITGGRGRRRMLRAQARATHLFSRALLALLRVRVDAPASRIPTGVLITSNHLSYLDIPVIAALVPGRFIAKQEIARWPVVGFLTRVVGTLFLERGRGRDVVRLADAVQETLEANLTVIFFPEGGISDGQTVQPYRGGLLDTAVRASVPCLPVCLYYETEDPTASPVMDVGWADDRPLVLHFWRLLNLGGIRARVRLADAPLVDTDRKRLARRLREATLEQFEPLRR